jgi:membrane protein YqaA with SNARE-associated domain
MVLDLFLSFLTSYGPITLFLGSFATNFLLFPAFIELSSIVFLGLGFSPSSIFISLTLGSILGGIVGYYLGFFNSRLVLKYEKRVRGMEKLIEKWGNLSVLLTSSLPVPFPFALFAILVGFLKMDVKSFFISMAAGKCLRVGLSIFILTWGMEILKFYHLI